ncbi:hypothetical protein ACFL54_06105 [Planctomycetota bacterium]
MLDKIGIILFTLFLVWFGLYYVSRNPGEYENIASAIIIGAAIIAMPILFSNSRKSDR